MKSSCPPTASAHLDGGAIACAYSEGAVHPEFYVAGSAGFVTGSRGAHEVVMKWITRKDIKADRVACPWLIKRFVDPQAEFLFVEEEDLLEQAKLHDAIPFDAPKIEAIKLNHRGSRRRFEAILEDYAVADSAFRSWHSLCVRLT